MWLTFGSRAATFSPAPKQGWVDDGAYVSKYPATNPTKVRNYNGSSAYAFAVSKAGMRHTALNVGVGELVEVNKTWPYETKYKAGSLQSRIADVVKWNKEHPKQKLTVHLRFHVGKSAPQAWKDLCGTVQMGDPRYGVSADAPRWWVKDDQDRYTYRQLYKNAMVALAQAVSEVNAATETKNIIGSVNAPGAAPNYAEPMLLYTSVESVRKALIAGGFTAAEHDAFMLWFPTVAKHFKGITVELAINPYQSVLADGKGDYSTETVEKYKQVAQSLIDTVQTRAVLMSLSARENNLDPKLTKSNDYTRLFAWMVETKKSKNIWIGVQLDRPPRVATTFPPRITSDNTEKWDDVARWAAARGFNFVETTGPKVSQTIAGITQTGKANTWPGSYNDDSNDISDMQAIGKKLYSNSHPTY